MDIAALSMAMSTASLKQSVGVSLAKKSMDQQEVQAQGLLAMLPTQSVAPPSDSIIDVYA